jgi:hypothetical protein
LDIDHTLIRGFGFAAIAAKFKKATQLAENGLSESRDGRSGSFR